MSSINTSCNQCGTKNCPKMCSGCKKVYYCDKNCQVKNWKAHKSVCLKNSVDLDHSKGDVTVAETEKVMKELVPLESSLVLCPNAGIIFYFAMILNK